MNTQEFLCREREENWFDLYIPHFDLGPPALIEPPDSPPVARVMSRPNEKLFFTIKKSKAECNKCKEILTNCELSAHVCKPRYVQCLFCGYMADTTFCNQFFFDSHGEATCMSCVNKILAKPPPRLNIGPIK